MSKHNNKNLETKVNLLVDEVATQQKQIFTLHKQLNEIKSMLIAYGGETTITSDISQEKIASIFIGNGE